MRHLATLAAVLFTAAPLAANPLVTDSFRDAKSGYRVEISHSGATMLLDGYNPATHDRFHLVVTPRGAVTGVFQGQPVNYVLGEHAQRDEVAVNTAR